MVGQKNHHKGRPAQISMTSTINQTAPASPEMAFHIVNTESQNSPCVFAISEAEDSVTNLKVIADRFGEDLKKLEGHTWK